MSSQVSPQDHARLLDRLFDEGLINLLRGRLLGEEPAPLPATFDWDRVDGMLLGIAIGDALGNSTESMSGESRRDVYGEVRDYLPTGAAGRSRLPLPTTRSSPSGRSTRCSGPRLRPRELAHRFSAEEIFGIGSAVWEAIDVLRRGRFPGTGAARSRPATAPSCASLRCSPPPCARPPPTCGSTRRSRRSSPTTTRLRPRPASPSSPCSGGCSVWTRRPSRPGGGALRRPRARPRGETGYRPRGGAFTDYEGPLWRFVEQRLPDAHERGLSAVDACDAWYPGAYLLETVPSVLYVLARHAGDPEEAIVRAVNDTKDNDTVAAIVGAAVGALHGARRCRSAGSPACRAARGPTTTARCSASCAQPGRGGDPEPESDRAAAVWR